MAVRGTVMFEVAPEEMADFVGLAGDIRGILTRLGAKEVRFWAATVAGPNSGRVSLAAEFEDMAAWGAAQEAYATDSEFQAISARAVGTQIGRAVWTEIAPD